MISITQILKNTTKEADEQFYRDTEGTGILGSLSRAAIRTKSALGFDEYFRGSASVDNSIAADSVDGNKIMADQDTSTVADSDPGSGNGWEGSNWRTATAGVRKQCKIVRYKTTI